jgi:predicted DNA-binding antitoxin AbrB/MazE fold protein
VPNTLTDAQGQKVKLKEGAEVEIKIEADPVVTKAVTTAASQQRHERR